MAGTIIVSSIKTDTDNSFIVRSNTGATLFSVDTTSISIPDGSITSAMIANGTVIAADILDGTITDAKIAAVANTKITGLITAGQIASVANTQITGVLTDSQLPAGSVIQVVQATYSTAFNTGSTSYVDTGLSASITPTSSSNKILVLVNQGGFLRRTSTSEQCGYVNLVRNSTQVTEFVACKSVSGYVPFFNGINYLDSPNTTSSITYKTQTKVDTAADSGLIYFQSANLTSTIILMEIKG